MFLPAFDSLFFPFYPVAPGVSLAFPPPSASAVFFLTVLFHCLFHVASYCSLWSVSLGPRIAHCSPTSASNPVLCAIVVIHFTFTWVINLTVHCYHFCLKRQLFFKEIKRYLLYFSFLALNISLFWLGYCEAGDYSMLVS